MGVKMQTIAMANELFQQDLADYMVTLNEKMLQAQISAQNQKSSTDLFSVIFGGIASVIGFLF